VNARLLPLLPPDDVEVVRRLAEEAQVDERGAFVQRKKEPRGLWHAMAHRRGQVWAYVLGRRQEEGFLTRNALREPCGITRYSTDAWGADSRHRDAEEPQPGKRNPPKMARQPLTVRTRIKRLARQTSCFSTSIEMHDRVIGLFVHRYELGLRVSTHEVQI
jgi:insertion element IS1 protein InsB